MDGEESMVTDTLDRARREFLYPVIARMADDSLQAAVLELRIKHAMMYPTMIQSSRCQLRLVVMRDGIRRGGIRPSIVPCTFKFG